MSGYAKKKKVNKMKIPKKKRWKESIKKSSELNY